MKNREFAMLLMSEKARRMLKANYWFIRGVFHYIDDNGDLYRLLPNGDVFIHWQQENDESKYSDNGAFIGNLNWLEEDINCYKKVNNFNLNSQIACKEFTDSAQKFLR